jgi:HSP20 family protein
MRITCAPLGILRMANWARPVVPVGPNTSVTYLVPALCLQGLLVCQSVMSPKSRTSWTYHPAERFTAMNKQSQMPVPASRQAVEAKPFGPIGRLRDEIDQMFTDFSFGRPLRSIFAFTEASPAVELIEKQGGYELSVEIPGMAEKDIDIELAEGVLTVSGEKREESETKDSGYLISERRYGTFSRQVALPVDVDPGSIKAKVSDGVLKLDMKKDEAAASRSRKIPIG